MMKSKKSAVALYLKERPPQLRDGPKIEKHENKSHYEGTSKCLPLRPPNGDYGANGPWACSSTRSDLVPHLDYLEGHPR